MRAVGRGAYQLGVQTSYSAASRGQRRRERDSLCAPPPAAAEINLDRRRRRVIATERAAASCSALQTAREARRSETGKMMSHIAIRLVRLGPGFNAG